MAKKTNRNDEARQMAYSQGAWTYDVTKGILDAEKAQKNSNNNLPMSKKVIYVPTDNRNAQQIAKDVVSRVDVNKRLVKKHGSNYNPEEVRAKQRLLIKAGYDLGKSGADGDWGPKTQKAWEDYQAKNQTKTQVKNNNGSVIYLHYPNFTGSASNVIKVGKTDIGKIVADNTGGWTDSLPVGHGEMIVFDKDNNAKLVRYGRYTTGTGVVRPTKKGGNWGIFDFEKRKLGESTSDYIKRVKGKLEDSKYGAFEAIEIPNIDSQKVLNYANSQANNVNREEYNLSNTCASAVADALKQGMTPEQAKHYAIGLGFSVSDANKSVVQTLWGLIPGSTNQYAAGMRRIGTSTIIK